MLFFIAENIRSNIRELEGSLVRLSALASLTGSAITIDLAREVLGDYIRSQQQRTPDVLEIQKVVAAHFELPVESLRGKRRTSSVALARQVAMYLTKQLTTLTLVEIGRRFGNRDHSTVLYACARVAERVATDPAFAQFHRRIRHGLTTARTKRRSMPAKPVGILASSALPTSGCGESWGEPRFQHIRSLGRVSCPQR